MQSVIYVQENSISRRSASYAALRTSLRPSSLEVSIHPSLEVWLMKWKLLKIIRRWSIRFPSCFSRNLIKKNDWPLRQSFHLFYVDIKSFGREWAIKIFLIHPPLFLNLFNYHTQYTGYSRRLGWHQKITPDGWKLAKCISELEELGKIKPNKTNRQA